VKRLALTLLIWLAASAAMAQIPVTVIGPVTPGNLPQFNSPTVIKDSGIPASSITGCQTAGAFLIGTGSGTQCTNVLGSAAAINGSLSLGGASIGANSLAVTGTSLFNNSIQYGGVVLSNSVTGTGSMVLSAGPTFTNTVTMSVLNASTIDAFTLGGNINGFGFQLNNIIIGASNPLAGTFTTVQANTSINVGTNVALPTNALFAVNNNPLALPNPGVGTSAETWVARFAGPNGQATVAAIDAFGNFPALVFERTDGTSASPTALVAGDIIGAITAHGYASDTNYYGGAAQWRLVANPTASTWTSTDQGAYASVFSTPAGSAAIGGLKQVATFLANTTATVSVNIGVAGSLIGSASFANATNSGVEYISPATGALGNGVATLSAGTYNIVGDALANIFTKLNIHSFNAATLPTTNAGVGSTNTQVLLRLANADSTITRIEMDAFAQYNGLTALRSEGTGASPTATGSAKILFAFQGGGYDGTNWSSTASQIQMQSINGWTTSDHSTLIAFATTPAASTTPAFALYIQGSGGISVGTAADPGINNIAAARYFSGSTGGLASKVCTINTSNVTTGITITITGGIVTGTTTC
jgi:hypothetical protein